MRISTNECLQYVKRKIYIKNITRIRRNTCLKSRCLIILRTPEAHFVYEQTTNWHHSERGELFEYAKAGGSSSEFQRNAWRPFNWP